jgi:isopenicillin N synthase-like dioxygenase
MPPAQRPDQFRPVASLPVISLSKLYGQSALEYDKVQKACTNTGIFYLDLDGCPEILSLWTELLRFSEAYFTQPLEAKQKNDHRSELYGRVVARTSLNVSQS